MPIKAKAGVLLEENERPCSDSTHKTPTIFLQQNSQRSVWVE
jgi:hypothetical protein